MSWVMLHYLWTVRMGDLPQKPIILIDIMYENELSQSVTRYFEDVILNVNVPSFTSSFKAV